MFLCVGRANRSIQEKNLTQRFYVALSQQSYFVIYCYELLIKHNLLTMSAISMFVKHILSYYYYVKYIYYIIPQPSVLSVHILLYILYAMGLSHEIKL